MNTREYHLDIAGKKITAVFSDLADQANGSVLLSCENTVVLATAVISKSAQSNQGFFNLTVDYLERYYASGLILGSQYNKREGKPSDEAILSSRIIDRTIRPLFPQYIKNAVQVVTTVLSVGSADPGVLAVNAASLALGVSDIPWAGPVGAVHIGRARNGEGFHYDAYVPHTGDTGYDLDLTVCGHKNRICMIESMAFEISEQEMSAAFDMAMEHITKIEAWQNEIIEREGKVKLEFSKPSLPEKVLTLFDEHIAPTLSQKLFSNESKKNIHNIEDMWDELIEATFPLTGNVKVDKDTIEVHSTAKDFLHEKIDEELHKGALEKGLRADGRGLDEVRPLFAQAGGISPLHHGAGIFYRGETHVLNVLTLGGPQDAYVLDGMEIRGEKRFMHHYNFPPYSVGETGRMGGINRREMGHGFLAEKALTPVIPDKMTFPYTIRLVSECMASNGSTSQASICAGTLALMDGGVPIKAPVAGIAIGLMMDEHNETNYKLLTDIQGPEDHHGDMDFKIGGTKNGITALQLDIKLSGVPVSILKEALEKGRVARNHILNTITQAIPEPRKTIAPTAPQIIVIKINPDQIGLVIGGGGKTVKNIKEVTGADINIEDDGTIYITGKNGSAEKAKMMIEAMTHEFQIGEEYDVEIVKVIEVGAIAKLNDYTDGMIHVSEIAPFRVMKVDDVLKIGMKVPVKVVSVDKEKGRVGLSIKARDKNFIKNPYPEKTHASPSEKQ